MLFFHPCKAIFFLFCFPNTIMYILNIVSAIKLTINELRDFIFENYYRQFGFARENSYYSMKHQKKKDQQLFATKLTEKYLILVVLKILLILFKEKR